MVILLGELACFERRKAFELSDVGDSRTTAEPLPSSALGFLFECLQKDDTQWQLAEETRIKQVRVSGLHLWRPIIYLLSTQTRPFGDALL